MNPGNTEKKRESKYWTKKSHLSTTEVIRRTKTIQRRNGFNSMYIYVYKFIHIHIYIIEINSTYDIKYSNIITQNRESWSQTDNPTTMKTKARNTQAIVGTRSENKDIDATQIHLPPSRRDGECYWKHARPETRAEQGTRVRLMKNNIA